MDSELFSFLDPSASKDVDLTRKSKKKKRKHATELEVDPMEDAVADSLPVEGTRELNAMEVDDGMPTDDVEPVLKRVKLDEESAPLVVDEFETEAKRELKADAGLSGGDVSGSSLLLTHQVS